MIFDAAHVLSVTTGRMLVRDIGGIYAILNHMTGASLYTHELPGARDECAPELIRQFPALAVVRGDEITADNWESWLAEMVAVIGDDFDVAPLAAPKSGRMNPVASLLDVIDRAEGGGA